VDDLYRRIFCFKTGSGPTSRTKKLHRYHDEAIRIAGERDLTLFTDRNPQSVSACSSFPEYFAMLMLRNGEKKSITKYSDEFTIQESFIRGMKSVYQVQHETVVLYSHSYNRLIVYQVKIII